MPIKILIVDDHPLFRDGISLMLNKRLNAEIVGELASLEKLRISVAKMEPDLIILDYQLPGGDTSAEISYLKKRYPEIKIILISGLQSGGLFYQMKRAGADGLATKDGNAALLIKLIQRVLDGESGILTETAEKLIAEMNVLMSLTARESQVYNLIISGLNTQSISDTLCIAPKTVDKHRENLMKKLGAHSKSDLIRLSLQHELV